MEQLSMTGKEKSLPAGPGEKKKKKKNKKKEESLQLAVSKYIRSQYPDAVFNSDIASGMRLPIWIGSKAKAQRSERGQPDMVILEPKGKFFGMCLELKNKRSDVFLMSGLISDAKGQEHVREQAALLKRLREKGYWADFVFGYEEAKMCIDQYFSL